MNANLTGPSFNSDALNGFGAGSGELQFELSAPHSLHPLEHRLPSLLSTPEINIALPRVDSLPGMEWNLSSPASTPLDSRLTLSANTSARDELLGQSLNEAWVGHPGNEIFFIDSTVSDRDTLLADLAPDTEVIQLDASRDGVEQISEVLSQHQEVSAVHILSHGSDGALQLGNTTLNTDNLNLYQTTLQTWGSHLTANADILLYGCDVAQDAQGQGFVDLISQWTGADVAASDDLTGSTALGGDWLLEYQHGAIEAKTFSNFSYQQVLASASLTSGKLVYTSDGSYSVAVGDSSTIYDYKNQLTFALSGTDLLVTETNNSGAYAETISAGTGLTQVDSYSFKVAISSITSGIEISTEAGADTITFSSGFTSFTNAVNITVNAGDGSDTVTFSADVNTKGGAISISGDDGGDEIALNSTLSTEGGTLSISGGSGTDTVTLGTIIDTQGSSLSVTAETIAVDSEATLSTRTISGADYATGTSTGNSGNITFTGQSITIGSGSAAAQLFTQVDGTTYSAGSITITASATEAAATVFDGLETSKAAIALNQATLKGGTISLSADADYADTFEEDDDIGEFAISLLDNFSLAGGGAVSKSVATISVDSSTNITATSFDATASATTNATITPLFSYILGAAYAKADATAKVTIAGAITTTGNFSISTETDNTVDAEVSTSKWDSTNAATSSAAAAAISELYSTSTAQISDTASITAGGNVSVTANTIDRNYTLAKSKTSSNGTAAIAAAVSLEDGDTNALVDGTINATGNITVTATQENEDVERYSGLLSAGGVRAFSGVTDTEGDVISGVKSSVTSGLWNKLSSLVSSKSSSASSKTSKTSSVQGAAAVAYVDDTNHVTARIGGKSEDSDTSDTTAATITTQGTLTLSAQAANRPDISASSALDASSSSSSSSSSSTSSTSFAGSAAIAIGDYNNTVKAYIGDSATVNVKNALSISAEALNNYSTEWGTNLVDPFTGSGAWYDKASDFVGSLAGYLNNNLGLDEYVFDSWSQATATNGATTSVAGAVTILSLDHTSDAYIATNAKINQDTSLRSDAQTVSIEANSVNDAVNLGGNIKFPGVSLNTKTNSLSLSAGGVGTNSDNAVGGTALVITFDNNVSAAIADNVTLYADSLDVTANTDVMNIDVAASGGSASTFGFSGTGAWIYANNDTTAQINDGASIVVGDNLVSGTSASLVVEATDNTNLINVMGGVTIAESIGIGASIGFNTLNRTTRAVIGNLSDADETDATATVQSGGAVKVNAENDGWIGDFSLASAVSTGGSVTTDSDGTSTGSTSYGIDISGDVAINEITDTTEAYICDQTLTVKNSATVTVTATNDSDILAIGGAISITIGNNNESTASVGLAGSYGQNTVSQTTNAYINNSTVTGYGLTVTADNTSEIYAVTASGSGAANSDVNVAIAGAVAINEIDNSTQAYVSSSTATITGTVTVSAIDESTLHTDAGGAALAVGIGDTSSSSITAGVGIAYNDITNTISAYIDASTVSATGNIALSAQSTATIDAFALGGAASVSSSGSGLGISLSGAGAGSENNIANTIAAYIASSSTVKTTSTGSITLTATDDSDITADSGGYAIALSNSGIAGGSASVGVSIANNDITNTITAYIDQSTVTSVSTLTITAQSTAEIDALSIGAAASGSTGALGSFSLSGAGAATTNQIDNAISAKIQNGATVTTKNDAALKLTATDASTITADAGGVAIAVAIGSGVSASVGASIATNEIGQEEGHSIKALIDNATVNADGDVTLSASSTATIDALSFSGAASASGSSSSGGISLSGSGTGTDNAIESTILAAVQNSGKITAQGDDTVSLTATDDSEITSDSGAVSLALTIGSGAALSVGVAIAENEISNTVQAYLDKGTVSTGTLTLNASSTATIDTLAMAGAVSVAASDGASVSAAGAGTGVTNTISNTIQAFIQNSSSATSNRGDITLTATDNSTIESVAVGGSIAISGSSGASFSMAIGAVEVTNTLDNTVQAYIGTTSSDSTTVTAADDLTLTATSTTTLTDNTAVAASLAAGVAPASASFSGAGASITNTTTNQVEAFIRNVNTVTSGYNVKAADQITLTASTKPQIDATVGSGTLTAAWVGASVGISIAETTVNDTVTTYIDNARVGSTNGNLSLSATATPDIDALAVATSVAASIGGAGAGAEATATVESSVEARIGSSSTVKANTINVTANSTDQVTANSYGISAGLVAVGASVADATTESSTKAHVTGATLSVTDLNITATSDGTVDAEVTAIAGGLSAAGTGSDANAKFATTVNAYVGDSTTLTVNDDLTITATAQPKAIAEALGVSASASTQMGYSQAIAEVSPEVNAYIGSNSTITANDLTLLAQVKLPTSGDSASADSSGSGGALWGSFNASSSEATNDTQTTAYVGKYSTLTITNTASLQANSASQQNAYSDGYNGGVLAIGFNLATAESDLTTETYLDTGVNLTANALILKAIGDDNNYAETVAGGGGLISGRAADSTTNSDSTAKVRIEDGDSTSSNVEIEITNTLTIDAEQTTEFNSKANSVNASIVGMSGAITTNTVDTTVSVDVGVDSDNTKQSLVINAGSLTINATNTILKPELSDENAESGSGGVVDGSAVLSETTIDNTTVITLGDSSTSNGFDTTIAVTGDVDLAAFNDVSAWDETTLDSGGLISVAKAESSLTHDTNLAKILIQDVNLTSDGDITLSVMAEEDLEATANASSYGLAGAPSAYSTASTNTQNQIQLTDGAYLRSEGDVNLLAGQNAAGETNTLTLNAYSNVWNYTAIPVDEGGDSDASITLENTITIDSGAKVLTVYDTNLLTQEGDTTAVGVLTTQDAYEALVGLITDSSVKDISRDDDNITSTNGVTVNGTIQVSIENQETLTIDESLTLTSTITVDGVSVYPINITEQSDGIGTVTLSVEDLYSNISDYIVQLEELQSAYAGDTSTVAAYTAEIAYWETQLDELGSVTSVTYIEVPDITVKVGDIRVTGDYLTGSGILDSPGDAQISITNASPYYLRINDLTIPEVEGGRILFNSVEVTSNTTISARNSDDYTASFSQITTADDDALIEVENTYDPTFAVQEDEFTALGVDVPSAPDLYVVGSVENLKGTVRLSNDEGSVVVTGSIDAETIDIDSGSDFVLSDQGTVFEFSPASKVSTSADTIAIANHGLSTGDKVFYSNGGGTSIGGLSNDRSYFAIVVDSSTIKLATTEDYATAGTAVDLTSTGSGTVHSLSLTNDLGFTHVGGDPRSQLDSTASSFENGTATSGSSSVNPSSTSSITASNNVFINARYLNINGLIQSGTPDRSLTLSSSLNTSISAFKTSYDIAKKAGSNPTQYLSLSVDTDGTSIDAKYNAAENRIELDDVSIEGGFMELVGHILSTGDGKLEVIDGFGRINITNNTNYNVGINAIDTGGSGIEGKLIIIDTAQTGADGEALETTYTRVGNNITITDTSVSGGKTTTVSNSRVTDYDPLANQRYTWVTGQSSMTETKKTYKKSKVWGIDELAKDPGNEIESTTTLLDETPLLEGAFVETSTSTNLYEYSRDVVTTSTSTLVNQETWSTSSGWWVFKETTYYRRDTYQKGEKTLNTHSYNADSPIDVEFIGYDTGAVTITSGKNILLLGGISNEGGTTTLTATSGSIKDSSTNADATLTSSSLILSSTSGSINVQTDVNQLQFSAKGDVSITDIAGDVTLSASNASSTGAVTLITDGSILGSTSGTYDIQAYEINLTSDTGSIGSSTQALRLNSGISSTQSLSTTDGVSGLTLEAADDIYIKQVSGNLYLVSAVAGGDVTITVASGALIDNNLTETLDPYTQTQLQSLWSSVGLTTDRSSQAIASFKEVAENLYDTYWQYRNIQANVDSTGETVYTADAYNANFSYTYSDTAKANLLASGYTESEIIALAAEKTTQYFTLHTLLSGGSVTLTGDEAYMSTVITDLFKDSDFTGKNLTDISTYDPDLIANQYTVSSSQQSSLSQGSQWTQSQLQNTLAPGLFGSTTDTQYTIEAANIEAGGNVTVTTSGAIGQVQGTVIINNWSSITNWATDLTEEQQLALAYAERDDLTFYDASGNVIDNPKKSRTPIASVHISLKQDIDIDATGEINLTAGGFVFLGSKQDLNIDQVKAGDQVRIKASNGVYDVADRGVVNVTGTDLVLEAANGSVGSSSSPITIDLTDTSYYYNGKLYLLSNSATWENAQLQAQSVGGNLVTINDAAEEEWLRTTFGSTEGFWIGLTDKVTEGTFVWINGESTTYRNWATGEPNDWKGNEDYGMMNYGGKWNDNNPTATLRGIIEINVKEYNGHFYLLNPSATWETAQTAAQSVGGNLVTINDAAEEQWLKTTFGSTEGFWIGLTDKVTEGNFKWISGETSGYRNWATGEPNNYNGNEDYGMMNYGGKWNDSSSTATLRGIVEISALGATLTARAQGNIYVLNAIGNLNVDDIYATGDVELASTGAIIDANQEAENIESNSLKLKAISVGTITNALDLNLTGDAEVALATRQNVYLQTSADLSVDVKLRRNGAVTITGNSSDNNITLYSSSDTLNSALNINVDGGTGNDTLTIHPTRTPVTVNQKGRTVSESGLGTIRYSNTEAVKITPVAGNDTASTTEATSTTFTVLSNDADFDGVSPLTITAADGTSITAGTTITLSSGALVTFNADNTFTYDPNGQFEFVGQGKTATDSFTYTVTNKGGNSDTATVTITIAGINDAPTAVNDSTTTDEATFTTVSVLSNDYDIDTGDTFGITQVNGAAIASGTTITLASGATLTLKSTGTFTYNPNGKFESLGIGKTATDSFTYTIQDNNGSSSTATVTMTITGVNDAPTAVSNSATTNENTAIAINVLNNDSDIDTGDTISITKVNGTTITAGSSVILSSRAKVTLNANGTFTYDPNGKFDGLAAGRSATDSFTYTISDGQGGTSTTTVYLTITGLNDAPTAIADSATTNEDLATTLTPLSNDYDIDTDDKFRIIQVNGVAIAVGATVTLTSGAKLTFNRNGTFNYNPNGKFASLGAGETGSDSFTYTIQDNQGSTSTATVSISIKGGTFYERTGSTNLFNGVDVGYYSNLAFADIDKDGDLDAFVGASDGTIRYYRNNNGSFAQVTGTSNPFNSVSGISSSISFADLDKDGDLDAFIGDDKAGIKYYQNNNGSFTQISGSSNPFNGTSNYVAPSFADIDSDGDLDAFFGQSDGTLKFYRNTGSSTSASFTQVTGTSNPFNGVDVGDNSRITFGDVDLDGDSDAFIGGSDGTIQYYRNSNNSFTKQTGTSNLFNGIDVGQNSAIALGDLNNDGDLDAVIGEYEGNLNYFENTNIPPVAANDSLTTHEDIGSVTLNVLANDKDANAADTLRITKLNGTAIASGSTITLASGAKVTLNAAGTFTYNLNGKFDSLGANQSGTDSFTYTISDGKGGTSTATVNLIITGVNDGPTAVADSATTNEDITTTLSPLSNDNDVDTGDTFGITQVNGTAIASGSTVTLTSGAKVTFNSNGTFKYDPNGKFAALGAGETKTDSFTYTIQDSQGSTSTATITVSIKGGQFYEQTGTNNLFNGIDVGDNSKPVFVDIDKDGDFDAFVVSSVDNVINYYRNTGSSTSASFTQQTGTANPFNGVKAGQTLSFADIDKDGDLDAFIGDLKNGISFYRNTGSSTSASFTQQTGTANPFNGVSEGIAPTLVDIDNDGDLDAFFGRYDGAISYYRNTGSSTSASFTQQTGTSNPLSGVTGSDISTISLNDFDFDGDSDAFIGNSDGTISYYRNTGSSTSASFTKQTGTANPFNGVDVGDRAAIAFVDLNGDGDTDAFVGKSDGTLSYFENTNIAPVAANDSATTNEGTSVTIGVASNDSDANPADTLSVSKVNGTAIASGSTVTLTSGAKVTLNSTGTLSYNPNGKFEYLGVGKSATDSFTYTISDGKGGTSTATVSLTITGLNDSPTAVADSATTNEDTNTTITPLSNDTDIDTGDTLSITQVNGTAIASGATATLTSGAKVTFNSNGTFTYKPNGKFNYLTLGQSATDSFTYTISDGQGGTSTATITLTITGLTFRERTGSSNPFNGVDFGDFSRPVLVDIDKDGDLDAFVVDGGTSTVKYYRNTGSSTSPSFTQQTGTANPFNGVTVSTLSFGDIDKDGDLDAFISDGKNSAIYYYRNTGSSTSPSFTQVTGTANPLNSVSELWVPTLVDIDNDGDLDAFFSRSDGTISYYRNTGSSTNAVFTAQSGTANLFNNVDVGDNSTIAFADIDKDGDLDAYIGASDGTLRYYRNTGSVTSASFSQQTGTANPFNGVDVGDFSMVTFGDLDGDGDLDAFIGESSGSLKYYENK